MEKKIYIRSTAGAQPAVNKRRYARPVIELLSVNASCSLLGTSQTPWADAKHHKPFFDNSAWDDEKSGNDNIANENTNWAGYQKDMSIW